MVVLGGNSTRYVCLFTVLLPNRNGTHLLYEPFSSKRRKQVTVCDLGWDEFTGAFLRTIPQEFNVKLESLRLTQTGHANPLNSVAVE